MKTDPTSPRATRRQALLTLAATATFPGMARAAEVPAGTVITAKNYEQVKKDTFEGKIIESMIPKELEVQILNFNHKIKLAATRPYPVDPRWEAATKKYSGAVSFDAKTRSVVGYQAGLPFPVINESDPLAGEKIVWNFLLGAPTAKRIRSTDAATLLIDANKGLEKEQAQSFMRVFAKGNLDGEPTRGNEPSVLHKTLIAFSAPEDVRGLGLFSLRYNTGAKDDTWGYIRAARRVRRLSGSAWMDPIGGGDQNSDDIFAFNADPRWMESFKLLGKRWMLVVANGDPEKKRLNRKAATANERYGLLDFDKPGWNVLDVWEPREVYVVEVTLPSEHRGGKKVLYIDSRNFVAYYSTLYDRKGGLWKTVHYGYGIERTPDNHPVPSALWGQTVDHQALHATVFVAPTGSNYVQEPKDMQWDDVNLGNLERAAR